MEQDLSAYLASKGLHVFKANGAEVTIHCLFCPDGDPRGKGKMYLNAESWLWDCKRCGERGNRRTLLRHFGDTDDVAYLPGQDPAVRRALLDDAVAVGQEMLRNNDEMLEYLIGRGLKASTIEAFRLGYVPASWSLSSSLTGTYTVADKIAAGVLTDSGQDFFSGKLLIPYLSHGHVVQLRAKIPTGKYLTPAGESVRLFNADRLQGAQDVIIVEGEYDAMILQQTLELSTDPRHRATAVVGVAGAGALPHGFEHYFVEARRVYIALDPDDTGKKGALRIKEMLGSKARIVQLPEDLPKCDWTEFLTRRKAGLPEVIELLGTASGRRLWSIGDAGAKWRRRKHEAPGIQMGFSEVDAWFAPGMEPGDLIIPLAKTGCIQGDAEIAVNRAGKGFTIKLKDLVERWEGRRWAWDRSIDTYVQREVDGRVRLGRLVNAWCSGTKVTYTVTTETGRTIRATDEHPFLTERGWLRLDQLQVGDLVHVRGERTATDNVQVPVAYEAVVSVEYYGEEVTYDLEVADDPHNFLANGFVVHNTGKTNLLVNIAYNTRLRPTLMVSLEMTAPQVYERLRKVYHFYWPDASDTDIDEAYGNLRIVDQNRLTEGAVAELCDEYADEMGFRPQLVMVDYLGYYAKGCKGVGQYEKTTNAAMALKAEAKGAEVGLIAPHQVNRQAEEGKPLSIDDARDSGAVEETADLLVSLYRPQEAVEGAEQVPSATVRMGCLKNRKGPKGMACNLVFSAASLVLLDARHPMAHLVAEENRMIWRGDDYAAVRRYRQGLGTHQGKLHLA